MKKNPLHEYRSYSYHHILIACDTTVVAEKIAGLTSTTDSDVGNFTDLIYAKRGAERGIELNSIADGNYVVVINGARDGEFSIDDAKWSTLISPINDNTSSEAIQGTTMATEGSFNVSEPRGVRFLSIVNDIGEKLGTGPTGITWVMKTIFVGHTDKNNPKFIVDTKPLMFMLVELLGTFDERGSKYKITFVSNTNGAGKTVLYNQLPISSLSTSSESNTLHQVLTGGKNSLEFKLNAA